MVESNAVKVGSKLINVDKVNVAVCCAFAVDGILMLVEFVLWPKFRVFKAMLRHLLFPQHRMMAILAPLRAEIFFP
jgi:hypothetical protein